MGNCWGIEYCREYRGDNIRDIRGIVGNMCGEYCREYEG